MREKESKQPHMRVTHNLVESMYPPGKLTRRLCSLPARFPLFHAFVLLPGVSVNQKCIMRRKLNFVVLKKGIILARVRKLKYGDKSLEPKPRGNRLFATHRPVIMLIFGRSEVMV